MSRRAFQNNEEIRPAKGLKIKSNDVEKKETIRTKPQIIQGVGDVGELSSPTEETLKILQQSSGAKELLLDKIKNFNELLKIRTLAQNKTEDDKRKEQDVVNQLVRAALEVDELNPKEGVLSLCILAIRQILSLRDAGNEMVYKIVQLEKRINNIEENPKKEIKKEEKKDTKTKMLEISDLLKKLASDDKDE